MNLLSASPILGFTCSLLLFVFCFLLVVGLKTVWLFAKSAMVKTPPKKKRKHKSPTATEKPQAVRSIEINPEEIDRIYVKKSS